MKTAETEVELIEEFYVLEDRDPQRYVAPRRTGNSIREIEVLSSPGLSLTLAKDCANEARIANQGPRDHRSEIRERRFESVTEVASCLTREALRSQSVVDITRHQANVGRVEAHLRLDLIIRSRSPPRREVRHA